MSAKYAMAAPAPSVDCAAACPAPWAAPVTPPASTAAQETAEGSFIRVLAPNSVFGASIMRALPFQAQNNQQSTGKFRCGRLYADQEEERWVRMFQIGTVWASLDLCCPGN